MSSYLFIACEYQLATLYSPKLHKPDGRKINVFQCEDDLYDIIKYGSSKTTVKGNR